MQLALDDAFAAKISATSRPRTPLRPPTNIMPMSLVYRKTSHLCGLRADWRMLIRNKNEICPA